MARRSLSASLVDRASRSLDRPTAPRRHGLPRRSFLRRTTLAATALTVAPSDYVLRPRTAYAAVCRCQGQACPCGSTCCDGYTEFCCTLTGSNGCPPGTVAAGWWKVDGSGFCGGAPRYYMDCNAQCGGCGCTGGVCSGACSGTPCGCAGGDCNNRKWGCTRFRYGQCNQHLACVGPIVCRVATCTPPWVVDGSCTTASRTDNRTANHNRPCLEAPFGAFDGATDVGGAVRVQGWAIDQNLRDGVDILLYVDQSPAVASTASLPRPDVGAAYPYYGADHGFDVTIPTAPGHHTVCVLARDQGSRTLEFLAFTSVDVAGPIGSLDVVAPAPGRQAIDVDGWVLDPRDVTARRTVRVLVDGAEATRATTTFPRSDVAVVVPGAHPDAGFHVEVPAGPGSHEVCVDLLYEGDRAARLACAQVVVP
jgi:hypothetical protein